MRVPAAREDPLASEERLSPEYLTLEGLAGCGAAPEPASHSLREVLVNASAVLLLFTALSAAGLIRVQREDVKSVIFPALKPVH